MHDPTHDGWRDDDDEAQRGGGGDGGLLEHHQSRYWIEFSAMFLPST